MQRFLAALTGDAEASARIDEPSLRRIQSLALGSAIAIGAFTPILAALALSPVAVQLAGASVFVRMLVNGLLLVSAFVVASAAHGAVLHVLSRRALSKQQARRSAGP